jgi:hypothetical protein
MSRLSYCFRPSISGYQNSLIQPCDGQVRPERVFGIGIPTTCSNPFLSTFRTLKKHWGNPQKFGSCPLRSKTLVFPGFAAYWANCFGFPAYPCMSMPAGAASSRALPWTLVSRRVSRQSRFRTLIFLGKTYCFVAEVQDSN